MGMPPRADEQGIPGSLRCHVEAVASSRGSLHCLLIFNHFIEVSVPHETITMKARNTFITSQSILSHDDDGDDDDDDDDDDMYV